MTETIPATLPVTAPGSTGKVNHNGRWVSLTIRIMSEAPKNGGRGGSPKGGRGAVPNPWLEYARIGMLAAFTGWACSVVYPPAWAAAVAMAAPYTKGAIWAGGTALAAWLLRGKPAQLQPTAEDWSCGTYISGLPGSGKTAYAYQLARYFAERGWGFIWISIKPSLPVLYYLPDVAVARTALFAPASEAPAGLNFMRTYTGTAVERELVADQVAELFTRLHSAMSANMRELLRMGALALLIWADSVGEEVTFWELYRLFQSESFRSTVLSRAPRPIRDAFDPEEARKQTLQACKVQLRRAVTSEALLVALSQRNGIDLWEVIEQERILVCDTPEGELGPSVASFLCQVVCSRIQMLTSRRAPGGRPFGVFADEIQEYSTPSFAKAIATAREYRVAWFLINQSREGQAIGREVQAALQLCGTRVYFQQSPDDMKAASTATMGHFEPESFVHLPSRHYRAMRRVHGRPVVEAGTTVDLPARDPEVAGNVIARANSGPGRADILREIMGRKVERGPVRPDESPAVDLVAELVVPDEEPIPVPARKKGKS